MTQPKPRPEKRPSKAATTGKSPDTGLPHGITHEDLIDFYRRMVLVRTIDERIWMMNRQGKVPIAASSQGHEATQLGSLLAAEKDGDCFLFTYYRDLAVKMAAGLTPSEVMKSFMGKEGDPYSNGRQFPLQGADLTHKIIQLSNVVAAGLTQAVGYALASRMQGEDTVSIVYFGDGASSQGESHEAMNFAGVHKLPVIFLCENNGYAISVPQRSQMAITDIANRAEGYGLAGVVVDGMDIIQVYEATREAIVHARTHGPVLLEMKLERFMPHTTDDDDKRYRPAEEVDNIRQRDPVITMGEYMVEHGYLTITDIETISKESVATINKATDEGEAAPLPDPSTIFDHLFKE